MEEQTRAGQERLQASARLATMGEMASLVSHELNQPLAAISSYATGSLNLLAQLGQSGEAQAVGADLRQAMSRIAAQAERADSLYRWRDDAGNLQITDEPPKGRKYERISCKQKAGYEIKGERE